jgi:hypothetical protein
MTEAIPSTARLLITAATLAYGLGPFVIDMNKTHLLHPRWPGHARLHLLWASVSQLAVAILAFWLMWSHSTESAARCRLSAIIGLCMTSGFWIAVIFRKTYRGTLHDPDGIPPIAGKIDGNLIAVLLIDALLIAGLMKI